MTRRARTSSHVLFLGAGASIPLAHPGSIQLVQGFERAEVEGNYKMRNKLRTFFATTRKIIESWGFAYDSESFYELIQGHSEPSRYLKTLGVFASSASPLQLTPTTADTTLLKVKADFEDNLIANYYQDNPSIRKRITFYYNRLFSRISGKPRWRTGQPDWKASSFDIFTTNYDYTIETYSENIGQFLLDGKRVAADKTVIFTPEVFTREAASLKLYKLHGSVGLSRTSKGVTYEIPPPLPSQRRITDRGYSNVLVYGIEKNVLQEPFFDLLVHLKNRLMEANRCTVLGYSFRDPWIVQLFREVMVRSRGSFRMDYISPHASHRLHSLPFPRTCVNPVNLTAQKWLGLPRP